MTNAEQVAAIQELQKQIEEILAALEVITKRIAPIAPLLSE